MGLLFGKKLSDGNVVFKKRLSDSDIGEKDIIDIGKDLQMRGILTSSDTRRKVEEILNKSQSGGITIEEVHEGIQKIVAEGGMTVEKAGKLARELGLEEKRFRYFKDMSEMKHSHEIFDSEANIEYKKIRDKKLKVELDERGIVNKRHIDNLSEQKFGNESDLTSSSSAKKPKPNSIWNILSRPRN